jgi:hypothetical protein
LHHGIELVIGRQLPHHTARPLLKHRELAQQLQKIIGPQHAANQHLQLGQELFRHHLAVYRFQGKNRSKSVDRVPARAKKPPDATMKAL